MHVGCLRSGVDSTTAADASLPAFLQYQGLVTNFDIFCSDESSVREDITISNHPNQFSCERILHEEFPAA